MTSAAINSLPEVEWLLVRETEPSALANLGEEELLELHQRVRRTRNKYVTNYRRGGSARVSAVGGRGKSYAQNARARDRAEVFEVALARVSASLSTAARRSAAELKAERIAAARGEPVGRPAKPATSKQDSRSKGAPNKRTGDRDLKSPRSLKKGAGSRAQGARRQAKKDSRNA